MGYRTPNIDRIANEGALLTDYYGQQSCTAGRAAVITGQSPMRTGLLKVGLHPDAVHVPIPRLTPGVGLIVALLLSVGQSRFGVWCG